MTVLYTTGDGNVRSVANVFRIYAVDGRLSVVSGTERLRVLTLEPEQLVRVVE